jgi:hypothetical protein
MARLVRAKGLITVSCLGLVLGGCLLDDGGDEKAEQEASRRAAEQAREPGDGDDSADECTSTMTDFGLVCTSCPGDGGPPECLVGFCGVSNRCLECTDPKGRVAIDCSIDYESLYTEGTSIGGGETFNVCGVTRGYPGGASGTCLYPGTESCTYFEEGDGRCIECTSGTLMCMFDPDYELPDVMAGRPSTLPAPGECITETSQGDTVQCSTCTREDLSATKNCRFPPAESCTAVDAYGALELCIVCVLDGGGVTEMCDDAGT